MIQLEVQKCIQKEQNNMENVFHRVSIRKYEDKAVEKEKIIQILKAGMQAPSACNQQPWEFYVVTTKRKYRNCQRQPHIPDVQQKPRLSLYRCITRKVWLYRIWLRLIWLLPRKISGWKRMHWDLAVCGLGLHRCRTE